LLSIISGNRNRLRRAAQFLLQTGEGGVVFGVILDLRGAEVVLAPGKRARRKRQRNRQNQADGVSGRPENVNPSHG